MKYLRCFGQDVIEEDQAMCISPTVLALKLNDKSQTDMDYRKLFVVIDYDSDSNSCLENYVVSLRFDNLCSEVEATAAPDRPELMENI